MKFCLFGSVGVIRIKVTLSNIWPVSTVLNLNELKNQLIFLLLSAEFLE